MHLELEHVPLWDAYIRKVFTPLTFKNSFYACTKVYPDSVILTPASTSNEVDAIAIIKVQDYTVPEILNMIACLTRMNIGLLEPIAINGMHKNKICTKVLNLKYADQSIVAHEISHAIISKTTTSICVHFKIVDEFNQLVHEQLPHETISASGTFTLFGAPNNKIPVQVQLSQSFEYCIYANTHQFVFNCKKGMHKYEFTHNMLGFVQIKI